MSGARRVRIEKLASTGEGIARTPEGVGFVDRALPGELVETTLYEVRKKFWRGSLRRVLEPSADRVEGPHAGCAGCDWAHLEPAAGRAAKRELFLETMRRIGKLPPEIFGELPVAASGPAYRLRARFHVSGREKGAAIGYFAPGTHRVVTAEACEALSARTRALLPAVRDAIGDSGAAVSEVAILEDIESARRVTRVTAGVDAPQAARLGMALAASFDGARIVAADGPALVERGERFLRLTVGDRAFAVSAGSFFQANRFLVPTLYADASAAAASTRSGSALDAFGGVGLFAGALLSAGYRVSSVEADAAGAGDARRTRDGWLDRDRWEIAESPIDRFLEEADERFDCVIADPPRSGLGPELAPLLARRAAQRLIYVSCDPATLARDLPAILAEGFAVRDARLYDLFAFTHRVEAMIRLERAA